MVRLAPISAKSMVSILGKLGFKEVHRKGSHRFFLHPLTRKTATVPDHGSEDLGIGLLRSILRDIEMDLETFDSLR